MAYLDIAAGPSRFSKETFLGISVAVFLSLNAVLVLCYGLVGISGNSIFTGALLGATTASTILLGDHSKLTLRPPDLLFLGLICCVAASSLINERKADLKEIALFTFALAAYPAFRRASFVRGVREIFVWATVGIVTLGTIATTYAIIAQWDGPAIRPTVLGVSDAAATFFLMVCGFLIIAVTTAGLNLRKTLLLSAFVFFPVAAFSASQVRMTFIAIVASLLLAAFLTEPLQRKYFSILIVVILVGIAIGAASRYSTTKTMLGYAIEETKERSSQSAAPEQTKERRSQSAAPEQTKERRSQSAAPDLQSPSCKMDVNLRNSIAIRKALLRDALHLIPRAGAFGFGLKGFADISCMSMDVHNSYLQAFVEFGWIGGLCFGLAILIAAVQLFQLSFNSDEARFSLCGLAYVATISLAHGRLSGDTLLFAMLGLAVGVYDRGSSHLPCEQYA